MVGDTHLSLVDEATTPDAHTSIRAQLWMTLAFWSLSFAAMAASDILQERGAVRAIIEMRAALTGFGLLLCLLIHVSLSRFRHRSFRTRALILLVIVPIAAEAFAWANYFGQQLAMGRTIAFPTVEWREVLGVVMPWAWLFVGWSGLYFALDYAEEAKAGERRAAQFQAFAHRAKLQALAYQINPHLLFNSLNAVSALMLDGRIADAERMVGRLSEFLRLTLTIDPASEIALAKEVAIQREYLAIEQQRFPDLVVDIDVPEHLARAAVPALVLQPLIENAIKHGVARSVDPTRIQLRTSATDQELRITVANSGGPPTPASTPPASGVGLANVRERLRQQFGDRGQLEATPLGEGGYRATISLPLKLLSGPSLA